MHEHAVILDLGVNSLNTDMKEPFYWTGEELTQDCTGLQCTNKLKLEKYKHAQNTLQLL